MPDKADAYLDDGTGDCSPDYQDLTLSRETLHSKKRLSQMEENSIPSCHTAFPVDLKEVFELTNPNAEIHQAILRHENGMPMRYTHSLPMLHSPKEHEDETSDSEVTWRHVLRDQTSHSDDLNEPSEERRMWDEPQNLSEDVSQTEMLHPPKSSQIAVISSPENWSHVIKQTSGDKHLIKEQSQLLSSNDHGTWNHVMKQASEDKHIHASMKEQSQLLSANDHGAWNHVLEGMPSVAHTVMSEHKSWNHLLTEHSRHQEVPPMDLSGDCGKLTLLPERRDASCQVDDFLNEDHQESSKRKDAQEKMVAVTSSLENSVPQSMLNLIVTEASTSPSQVVVHNGIKPELYTQERHLVVQAGTKAQQPSAKPTPNYTCNHCSKAFGDSRSLQRHMLIHIGLRQYRCPVCNKAFMLNGDLTRHIRIHSGERPYACDICGRRFTLKGNLMQHFRTHTPEKQYACTICEKNYAQKDSLHRHIRAHFGEKPFECTTCNKRFTLKGDLTRHVLIHSGVKPHECKYCGRQFALKGNLSQHIRTHVRTLTTKGSDSNTFSNKTQAEPQLICDLSYSNAQKTFEPNSASSLKLTHESPYVQTSSPSDSNPSLGLSFCSECSKTFPTPEGLHEHVQLIHEQSTRLSSNRYLCNICQKEFSLKGDLTRHLNSHNGVKPYECEHCNKTFTLKSNLRQHMTTHRMDKTFACPMCSKSFGNRRNLNLHLRRHEQARANFTCTKCGRSFLAKSDHFFHDCLKNETAPSLDQPQSPVNTPPDSPQEEICSNPLTIETDAQDIKRESCHLDQELTDQLEPDSSVLTTVNGTQSFLGPFYRHLYFSTSHQSMIPTLKGLLHATSAESNITDFNRVAKTS